MIEVKEVYPLVEKIPGYLSPSTFNWVAACPLRGLYANNDNSAYLAGLFPAARLGILVHKVYEDFSDKLINNEEEFLTRWAFHASNGDQFLKYDVDNYGVFLSNTWQNLQRSIQRRSVPGRVTGQSFKVLTEETLTSGCGRIIGKPDLLILKNEKPVEIRDYKTGGIFDAEANAELDNGSDNVIKKAYQQQMHLYAWLANSIYGNYPGKLTLISFDGVPVFVPFTEIDLAVVNQKIDHVFGAFNQPPSTLANPSVENCRFCNYRAGCPFKDVSSPATVKDLGGIVKDVRKYPSGNIALTLENSDRLLIDRPTTPIDDLGNLVGKLIYVTFARLFYQDPTKIPVGLTNFYVVTKSSFILIKNDN
ncbi:PD-(D/E)XK nuclease family protein [Mucilaginibacter sp. Mucisp84]|uniref:PD-(D/E)XK nuclease family protein n=1 Tax=Mucilaginibacter sp. Mucisp84 TaxID=3243058 RepID=UPI0039A48068